MTHDGLAHFKRAPDGTPYAGDHLLIEAWNAKNLQDTCKIQEALEMSAKATGATILRSHVHSFGQGMGVSGVVVLAESHITIHTWPEYMYAAIDIFMCGDCDPLLALPTLRDFFSTSSLTYQNIRRGELEFDKSTRNLRTI